MQMVDVPGKGDDRVVTLIRPEGANNGAVKKQHLLALSLQKLIRFNMSKLTDDRIHTRAGCGSCYLWSGKDIPHGNKYSAAHPHYSLLFHFHGLVVDLGWGLILSLEQVQLMAHKKFEVEDELVVVVELLPLNEIVVGKLLPPKAIYSVRGLNSDSDRGPVILSVDQNYYLAMKEMPLK